MKHFDKLFFIISLSVFVFFSLSRAQNRILFPETLEEIAIFADQLPSRMSKAQIIFAANHYIGSQKLTLDVTEQIRHYNPNFIVLHYHLAIWQQQPDRKFIIDGKHWGNDWPFVSKHEDWFWHNQKGKRVRSRIDGKYLMNIMNPQFRKYWKTSIAHQILAGKYQGVFLDSASPSLLPWEVAFSDPRLAKDAACHRQFKELNGFTWCKAYEYFMKDLTDFLEALGFTTLPNIGALFTTWDVTDYYTTASGAFMEGAFDTQNRTDWRMSMERTLLLIRQDKIVIFQSYLDQDLNYQKRLYFLSCYLLVKGKYSYLNYFARTTLSWYPEWKIDLGRPLKVKLENLEQLKIKKGLYHRLYEKGEVFVNIGPVSRKIKFPKEVYQIIPSGGGPVNKEGQVICEIRYQKTNHINLPPWQGLIVLYKIPEN